MDIPQNFFRTPLGIASSNLTSNRRVLTEIFSSPKANFVGCISIKTIGIDKKEEKHSRIVFTDLLNYNYLPLIPGSVLCRGEGEWLSVSEAAELSNWIREKTKDLPIKIKLSLPAMAPFSKYNKILEDLKKNGAEFDIVEAPLKYLHKKAKEIDISNLQNLYDIVEFEFLKSFYTLIFIRAALKKNDYSEIPISLKIAPENFNPHILGSWLLAPKNRYFEGLLTKAIQGVQSTLSKEDRDFFADVIEKEEGADFLVLFDSEKFPVFIPSPSNFRTSILAATEGGYCKKGGAIAGKAIAKDSLKYVYLTYRNKNRMEKENFRIISSGGCDSGYDLATRLIFGASFVELCTSILRNSLSILERIEEEFKLLLRDWNIDIKEWNKLIGVAHDNPPEKDDYHAPKFSISECEVCDECKVWCWAANKWAKDVRRWPTNLCEKCTGCMYLCQKGRILIS